MRNKIGLALLGTCLFAGGVVAGAAYGAGVGVESTPVVPAEATVPFPCQEDEVLGYAPWFGVDTPGCIHVEGDRLEVPSR